MTREIKFRVWDFRVSVMLPPMAAYSMNLADYCYPDDVILLQYTGLKDKNGMEIYEGDIVTCTQANPEDAPWHGEIRWEQSVCGFHVDDARMHLKCWVDRPPAVMPGQNQSHYYEVIGNIYENPELLEGK